MNVGMKRFVFTALFLFFCAGYARANDVYVAQNSTGSSSGSDCGNAHSAAWFNSAANWGTGTSQIGPGTTVHLCGTFTGTAGANMLSTQGSGSAASPITLLFEANADFTAPYWGINGAIYCQNSYITIDGGGNGKVENTAAGNLLTYTNAQTSGIVGSSACTNAVVKHVWLHNIYVHAQDRNDPGTFDGSLGISICASNTLITQNVVDNSYIGINAACGGTSNNEVSFNTISFSNHHISAGTNSADITGLKVHDNDLSNAYNWDDQGNRYHHNAIMTFGDPAGNISGDYYNNFVHGVFSNDTAYGGSHTTALIFLEYGASGSRVFNNVLALDAGDPYGTANGFITIGGTPISGVQIYNNTISSGSGQGTCVSATNVSNLTIKNNIFNRCGYGMYITSSGSNVVIDYNLYFNTAPLTLSATNAYLGLSWPQWQALGYDLHGVNGLDPRLDSNYRPQSGSAAISIGANLTTLGIPALNMDKAGTARPSGVLWTAGAYQYGSASSSALNPPTGLLATIN